MQLNNIQDDTFFRKARKRRGRGVGSGLHKTCGRGHKGQKSRTGVSRLKLIREEGGQNPLYRRLPKRGFTNIFKKQYAIINLSDIQKMLDLGIIKSGDTIDSQFLLSNNIVSSMPVKLLSNGACDSAVNVKLDKVSAAAQKKIESLGGAVS